MTLDLGSPVILGPRREEFAGIPAARVVRPNPPPAACPPEIEGLILAPADPGGSGPRFASVPDGNRGAILPEVEVRVGTRRYAVAAKGVGARSPLYGDSPADLMFPDEAASAGEGTSRRSRSLTGEMWYGEAPFGAQGEVPATYGLRVTEMARGASIQGFHICPVVQVCEFPPELVREARGRYWYRRYHGPFLQEHRLVPSNVRLYHHSDFTLGQAPAAVLRAFGMEGPEQLDAFLESFIASGVAALTVFARTMRPVAGAVAGLDYANVWLDKDSVVARDGTIHFADLEGLEWVSAGHDWTVEERVREQFEHNVYEFLYALDLLLRHRERIAGAPRSQGERRSALVTRFEIALGSDPFVSCERSSGGLDLVVHPPLGAEPVPIRIIDLEGPG